MGKCQNHGNQLPPTSSNFHGTSSMISLGFVSKGHGHQQPHLTYRPVLAWAKTKTVETWFWQILCAINQSFCPFVDVKNSWPLDTHCQEFKTKCTIWSSIGLPWKRRWQSEKIGTSPTHRWCSTAMRPGCIMGNGMVPMGGLIGWVYGEDAEKRPDQRSPDAGNSHVCMSTLKIIWNLIYGKGKDQIIAGLPDLEGVQARSISAFSEQEKQHNIDLDGRDPAPIDRWFIPWFIGFQPSKVLKDFASIHSRSG